MGGTKVTLEEEKNSVAVTCLYSRGRKKKTNVIGQAGIYTHMLLCVAKVKSSLTPFTCYKHIHTLYSGLDLGIRRRN